MSADEQVRNVLLTQGEADALNKALLEVKRRGLGRVEFDVRLLERVARKVRTAWSS